MNRVADLVARTLAAHGVRFAFGMPGGEVVILIDALEKAGIRFVLCRHETAAAIMAAGASEVTGVPGLLVTTLGPGLANAVNGIADAAQEHAPLIVLSGAVEHGLRGRYTHQIIDQKALLQPLVKGSLEIEAAGAAGVTARAVALARRAPAGPVHLDIAPDTAAKQAPAGERFLHPPKDLALAIEPDCEAVQAVARVIEAAERPLILAGLEAARCGAGSALAALMERRDIPLVTTYKAKGVVDENHPLSLGGAGLSPLADRELLPLVRAADLVLLAGYDPIEMRAGWLDPFSETAAIVEIGLAAPDHGMHQPTHRVSADPAAFAAMLARAVGAGTSWPSGEVQATKMKLGTLFAATDGWGPHAAIATLQRVLPHNAIVTVDSGAHRILLSQQMKVRRPFGLLQSAGFCTMGAALPLAAGAKLAVPGAPVVAVLGDGGLEMGLGELGTLRDQGLAPVIVVFQDKSLALIELKQAQAGLARTGVRLGRTRFEEIAPAFGGTGVRVRLSAAFEDALRGALNRKEFTLIVCEIEARDYAGRI